MSYSITRKLDNGQRENGLSNFELIIEMILSYKMALIYSVRIMDFQYLMIAYLFFTERCMVICKALPYFFCGGYNKFTERNVINDLVTKSFLLATICASSFTK